MPELPEVETMCRGIRPIIGSRVARVEQPPCACRPCRIEPPITEIHRSRVGQLVSDIQRRGKRVMIVFEDQYRLVIEPRMSGLVLLADPPGVDHLRLRIEFCSEQTSAAERLGPDERPGRAGSAANEAAAGMSRTVPNARAVPSDSPLLVWDRRGLGTIRLMSPTEYESQIDARLGEDALLISEPTLRERLSRSGRAIKVALLDQTAVAGIGNLYAAEILFVAGIDPRRRCDQLSRPQWSRLHAAIGRVLNQAIAHEGSTLSDGTYRNALNQSGGYQNMHRVYDRAGELCSRCHEGTIRRIVQAQRSTFFCPKCQRRTGKHVAVGEIGFSD
ncbi:Fpg/Nei family DNA glycosylase [Allorhodopirellula solitaria]|uniref:Formamidopyrimidine-DNA glycosylase n=1 Tax=Allorhodopirellula solitaria TaxID=2527987 RepID=A0A5C5WZ28_9BACT|nr:DNA-formamidopyrimidine glycosylase family protein [Allorhodopirellula solitaria]TWT56224.1 Formamidopyrimidine-DNA glycosylase [Allorhodopirellula solitaria]